VRLLGSGAILREVIAAAALLAEQFHVSSEIWSVTSFSELAREAAEWRAGIACTRANGRVNRISSNACRETYPSLRPATMCAPIRN